jgi:hypothetical protein
MTGHAGTAPAGRLGERYVAAVLVVTGLGMLGAGVWSWLAPRSFARFVDFPYHEHFLHDLGVFQIGIGVTLLAAPAWRDARAVALTGFLVTNTLHAVNHALDTDLGGHGSDAYLIGVASVLAAVALAVRVRQLRAAASPAAPGEVTEPR